MKRSVFFLGFLVTSAVVSLSSYSLAAENCAPAGGLNFICGPAAAEDLVRIPGTHWIVGSGMAEGSRPGRLHLIDADKKTWRILYPDANAENELDART